jgi:hypothetical protein
MRVLCCLDGTNVEQMKRATAMLSRSEPKSVGHTARFVLDHAPCPVLLVRPLNRSQFPRQFR